MQSGGSGSASASTAASLVVVPVGTNLSTAVVVGATQIIEGDGPDGSGGRRREAESTDITGDNMAPAGKKQKKLTSAVWKHFTKEVVTKTRPDGEEEVQELWATCNRCKYKARAETVRGTTAFRNHLEAKHSVKIGQQTLKVVKGEDNTGIVQAYRYDAEVSLKKWQMAIVMHDYPFNIVEHEFFVDFIKSLRPSFSLKCRITTRKNIIEMYTEERDKLYKDFLSVSSRFSATMDMWTSSQNKGYMCITVHWIDDEWLLQRRIIQFMHVKGSHSGKWLGNEFCKSIMNWNLDKKVFALTLDNASSNDKCVQEVVPVLHKKAPLVCSGIFFHVRCLCHILNLVAQDGLKVIGSSVRNIRATVAIVKNSPLQWEQFMKCASEENLDVKRGLSLDCTTRWNSTFLMLKNAIYYRKAFEKLVFLNNSKYKKCAPADTEWDKALVLTKFLKKLHDCTELFSRSLYPTVNLFWWKFCEIKLAIDEWCRSEDADTSAMAKAMQEKYQKYWDKSNMALAIGCFLDPRYKKKLVEYFVAKIYPDSYDYYINQFMAAVNQLFQAYMSNTQEAAKATTTGPSVDSRPIEDYLDDMDQDIEDFLYDTVGSQDGDKSELDKYLKEEPTKVDGKFDILSWWKSKENIYPVLARLARDVLAVQVSTVASESAFSADGRVVDQFRTRLDPEVVQALICTKDWTAVTKRAAKPKEKIASLIDDLETLQLEPESSTSMNMTREAGMVESSDESD